MVWANNKHEGSIKQHNFVRYEVVQNSSFRKNERTSDLIVLYLNNKLHTFTNMCNLDNIALS